eukprot:TRINITY_DN8805_c0_g2_i1.p1 TRINITY_DN8805_c0_g2~~TRINITY_DN8805_c0_g2_i1.p1  ORF type:complete len:227 (+),score=37.88 TRINITY_DN8805_c0_g2_i1:259-939(+)
MKLISEPKKVSVKGDAALNDATAREILEHQNTFVKELQSAQAPYGSVNALFDFRNGRTRVEYQNYDPYSPMRETLNTIREESPVKALAQKMVKDLKLMPNYNDQSSQDISRTLLRLLQVDKENEPKMSSILKGAGNSSFNRTMTSDTHNQSRTTQANTDTHGTSNIFANIMIGTERSSNQPPSNNSSMYQAPEPSHPTSTSRRPSMSQGQSSFCLLYTSPSPRDQA